MKDLGVLHAMAHIYHQKLASGLLVALLQEACDIFNLRQEVTLDCILFEESSLTNCYLFF